MILSRETVIKALEGVLLIQNPILWEDNGHPTEEHRVAIKSVHENLNSFRQIVQAELDKFPNTKRFLGHLISERLLQNRPLESPIIHTLFPIGPIELENRLSRIHYVPNIETISSSIHGQKDFDKGDDTDETIRDLWAEFFVADFLVSTLRPSYIEKVVRGRSEPAVEFKLQKENEEWIVEVARLRKKDFIGETMPWGSKDCIKQDNINIIRKALKRKLSQKNRQIRKFINNEKSDFVRRIVALKTSQEEYQDCHQMITAEAKKLMSGKTYLEITHLLLIYDTAIYEFIDNIQAS